MISDKKGFLLGEELVKIIISVIAIALLAYLLFSLYNTNKNSNDLAFAEESLTYLIGEITAGRTEVEIYNPEDWWVVSEDNNLCICKDFGKCDDASICVESEFTLVNDLKITHPSISLSIDHTNKLISKI